jgi:hypothetical protein
LKNKIIAFKEGIIYIIRRFQTWFTKVPRARGANFENFKNSGGGGELIGFNGQLLAKSQNFVFNKNHNFLKIFAVILLESQREEGIRKETFLRNISEFSPKNFL